MDSNPRLVPRSSFISVVMRCVKLTFISLLFQLQIMWQNNDLQPQSWGKPGIIVHMTRMRCKWEGRPRPVSWLREGDWFAIWMASRLFLLCHLSSLLRILTISMEQLWPDLALDVVDHSTLIFFLCFSFGLTIPFTVLTGLCYVGKLQVLKILCSCSDILLYCMCFALCFVPGWLFLVFSYWEFQWSIVDIYFMLVALLGSKEWIMLFPCVCMNAFFLLHWMIWWPVKILVCMGGFLVDSRICVSL